MMIAQQLAERPKAISATSKILSIGAPPSEKQNARKRRKLWKMPPPHLIESDAHTVISLPDDAAWQFQAIVRHNQIEASYDGYDPHRVRKLEGCAGGGKITDRTGVFVATVFGDGPFLTLVAWGDPAFFVHRKP
jgi:hypothetical protein